MIFDLHVPNLRTEELRRRSLSKEATAIVFSSINSKIHLAQIPVEVDSIQNSLLSVFVAGGTALVVIGTIWCRSRAKELSLICQYYHVAVTAFENKEENNVN